MGGLASQPLTFEAISRWLDARALREGEVRDLYEELVGGLEAQYMEHLDRELAKASKAAGRRSSR